MTVKVKAGNELLVFEKITGIVSSKGGGGDRIALVKNYVESLDADAAQLSARKCSNYRGFSVFVLGGILKTINDNDWFKAYGYQSFKAMVEENVGLSTSTAYDYIKIYQCLTESGVPWSDIKHIGWTKIRWFAKHLTEANADEWIKEAGDKNVVELKQYIKQEVDNAATIAVQPKYSPAAMAEVSTQVDAFQNDVTAGQVSTQMDTLAGDNAEEEACPEEDVKPPLVTEASALDTAHTRSFKLYPEQEIAVNQALDHVKAKLQTEHNGVALEGVCIAYLRDSVHGG